MANVRNTLQGFHSKPRIFDNFIVKDVLENIKNTFDEIISSAVVLNDESTESMLEYILRVGTRKEKSNGREEIIMRRLCSNKLQLTG